MVTAKPASATLQGSGADIASQWISQMARMSSGDLIVLKPNGGVLEVGQPLTIPGDVIVTGLAAAPPGAPKGRRRLLAPLPGAAQGAVTVKCAKGVGSAFRIM
jgi:hypothetical protein